MQELELNQPLSDSESERLANRPSCTEWLPRQGLNLRPFAYQATATATELRGNEWEVTEFSQGDATRTNCHLAV
jgi:hypothetical protein